MKIICLTPVKNEAWILETFLKATSIWADHIIIADQNSTDGSIEIAQQFSKVKLIHNNSLEFNEPERQKLLINEARKIPGKKLLIALDADEFFTSGFQHSSDWQRMLNSPEGTTFGFRWLNIKPELKEGWSPSYYLPLGKIDNGAPHSGKEIHSARVPVTENDEIVKITDFQVMHFQYVDWKRMESKHRYYQCLERSLYPNKNAVDIFRMYHHMYHLPKNEVLTIDNSLFEMYEQSNIHLTKLQFAKEYWFDHKVIELFKKNGTYLYKQLNIWNINWRKITTAVNIEIKNPQSILDKLAIYWLKKTQKYKERNWVKAGDRVIKYKLWQKRD